MNDWKSASLKAFMFSCYKMMSYKTYSFLKGRRNRIGPGGKEPFLNEGSKTGQNCWWIVQWNLDLRKPDLRKNLDLRKIVGTTDFLVHKLFDLRKIF